MDRKQSKRASDEIALEHLRFVIPKFQLVDLPLSDKFVVPLSDKFVDIFHMILR
jgi:hypothetical protein